MRLLCSAILSRIQTPAGRLVIRLAIVPPPCVFAPEL